MKTDMEVTPGEFINKLREDIFSHTDADSAQLDIELDVTPAGFLNPQKTQRLSLKVSLERGPQANKPERKI